MTKKEELTKWNMTAEQLIQLKEMAQQELRKKQFQVMAKEIDLKNIEASLLLTTDFKELKLTNEKMRSAYIHDQTHTLKFEIDHLKYELSQQKDYIEILNDLITLRLHEIDDFYD